MRLHDLASLGTAALKRKPVDGARLIRQLRSKEALRSSWDAGGIPPIEMKRRPEGEVQLRLMLKLAAKADPAHVAATVRKQLRPTDRSGRWGIASRMSTDTYLRPLGRELSNGARWHVLHTPFSLGAVLDHIDYDLAQIVALEEELASIPGVLEVEADVPALNLVRPLQEIIPGCTAGRGAAVSDVAWAPRLVRYFDIQPPVPTGADIRIGHVDSGYTDHPELDVDAGYDIAASASFIDAGNGFDSMPGGSSHGTATGSIMTSAQDTTFVNDQGVVTEGVTGLVPGAKVVAVRVLDAVVQIDLLTQSAIVEGIWHCIESGCHVISMSFGGFMSQAVKDALQAAYEADIILCAAAGNCVQFVVEPASLPGVIACGGAGVDDAGVPHPWPGSSHGPAVDVSAPAENVWIADWSLGQPLIRPGEGTSYAAPHVACGAALWLEHHGRAALVERYSASGSKLCDVFRQVVRASAQVPSGWDTANRGAGILDLAALLQHPLPDEAENQQGLPMDIIDLIPTLSEPVDVAIDFDRIVVRDDGEFWGGAGPYLLLTFFEIDGDSARLECSVDVSGGGVPAIIATMRPAPGRDSFVRVVRRGNHGNVDEVNIGPVELAWSGPATIDIPNSVGRRRFSVKPIPLRLLLDTGDLVLGLDIDGVPGFTGVHAILAEQDLTPSGAVVAARNEVASGIRGILEEVLSEITLSDLSVDPDGFVERQAEIEDEAAEAARQEMNLWEAFWGGVVDPDDQLLQIFKFVNVLQIGEPIPLEKRYQGSNGDYILVGEIRRDD